MRAIVWDTSDFSLFQQRHSENNYSYFLLFRKRPAILLWRLCPAFIDQPTEIKSVFHPVFSSNVCLLDPIHLSLCFHSLFLSFSFCALLFPSLLLQSLWNCRAAGRGLVRWRNLSAIRIAGECSCVPSSGLNNFAASLTHPPSQSTSYTHTHTDTFLLCLFSPFCLSILSPETPIQIFTHKSELKGGSGAGGRGYQQIDGSSQKCALLKHEYCVYVGHLPENIIMRAFAQ